VEPQLFALGECVRPIYQEYRGCEPRRVLALSWFLRSVSLQAWRELLVQAMRQSLREKRQAEYNGTIEIAPDGRLPVDIFPSDSFDSRHSMHVLLGA
jgi:hypothetical protein